MEEQERIDTIINKYRETALDKEKFDQFLPNLRKSIAETGFSSQGTSRMVMELTDVSQCERGMFKDFVLDKAASIVVDVTNLNNMVKSRKTAITTDEYEKNKDIYISQVKCYALLDDFYYRSRIKYEMDLIKKIIELGRIVSEDEIFKMIEDSGKTIGMSNQFMLYCYGDYIKYGWLITMDVINSFSYYRVVPVGWDGKVIPTGGSNYVDVKGKV